MKPGLYLTTWDDENIQFSYVTLSEYYYVYIKNTDTGMVGFCSEAPNTRFIKEYSEPISEKRVYLLGYDKYYERLRKEIEKYLTRI